MADADTRAMRLSILMRELHARLLRTIGVRATQAMLTYERRHKLQQKTKPICVLADNESQFELVSQALDLLSHYPGFQRRVCERIDTVVFLSDVKAPKHFCDGTVFVTKYARITGCRLAAYLVRIAVENEMYMRFGIARTITKCPDAKAVAYDAEWRAMTLFGARLDEFEEMRIFYGRLGRRAWGERGARRP